MSDLNDVGALWETIRQLQSEVSKHKQEIDRLRQVLAGISMVAHEAWSGERYQLLEAIREHAKKEAGK